MLLSVELVAEGVVGLDDASSYGPNVKAGGSQTPECLVCGIREGRAPASASSTDGVVVPLSIVDIAGPCREGLDNPG